MTTRWAEVKEGEEPMFSTRMDVIKFLNLMLRHKFFHRAKKVPVTEQELKAKLKRKLEKEKKPDTEKRGKKGEEDKTEEAESSHAEGNKKDDKQPGITDDKENKKRKTKIRLEMHLDQEFVDGLDAYVWIYDPIPVYYWFFGTLLVLGAIAVCLFPLWPPSVSPVKPEEIAEETGLLAEREAQNSESESESSQKSQTGKDFEMVEKDEVES
uniref:Translocation protein SEC62 n=1 Tax=Timema cristinae TaxID=61476 RepID=A0A7R9CQG5_TIMCR|nr:unnamed protein product [Timema cristinae]